MQLIELHGLGHGFFIDALSGLDASNANEIVCGTWSLKDVLGHLTSYERVKNDLLNTYLNTDSALQTPFLDIITERGYLGYNDYESDRRKLENYDAILQEYHNYYNHNLELMAQVPHGELTDVGVLSWFYPQLDVEDFLIYSGFAHKLEHGAQLNILKSRLNA